MLRGIKVLELANVLAGPSVGMFLAELGAEVWKVENVRTNGDVTRIWKLPSESPDTDISAYYSSVNWGKQSLAVDLTHDEGLDIVHNLAKLCDIVLASYKPGDAEKLNVDHKTLRALNPRLIYGHITGYGADNPRAGFDAIIQAESGFTFMNGEPDGPPTKMPVALMDVLTAHNLKEGILLALMQRERTGLGQYIEASLIRGGLASLINQASNWLVAKTIPQRLGSDHPNIVPYGTIFRTKDNKQIVLAVGTEKQFSELCKVLGKPELPEDPRFSRNYERVINKTALLEMLQDLFLKFDRDQILGILEQRRIPAGGVFDMREAFETPEAQEMLLHGVYDDADPIVGVRSVAFNSDVQKPHTRLLPPPHYAAHTRHILKTWLGIDDNKIETLMSKGVIYARD